MKKKYAPATDEPFIVPSSWAELIDDRSADKLGQQFRDLVKDQSFRRRVVAIAWQKCCGLLEEFHHSKLTKNVRRELEGISKQLEQLKSSGAKLDPLKIEKLKQEIQSIENRIRPRKLPVPDGETLAPKFLWAFGFLGHFSLCFQEDKTNATKPIAEQDFSDETVMLAMLAPNAELTNLSCASRLGLKEGPKKRSDDRIPTKQSAISAAAAILAKKPGISYCELAREVLEITKIIAKEGTVAGWLRKAKLKG